ncbi:MAG TPA: chloride channel protein [Terriglobia bacterium]|nr:chloride channel protein [Terriglobia bacterium]
MRSSPGRMPGPASAGWHPVALGLVGAALARFLVVRFAPIAEGSGVQRVEAAFSGEVKLAPYSIVPVKFFGGLIAMGSGPGARP